MFELVEIGHRLWKWHVRRTLRRRLDRWLLVHAVDVIRFKRLFQVRDSFAARVNGKLQIGLERSSAGFLALLAGGVAYWKVGSPATAPDVELTSRDFSITWVASRGWDIRPVPWVAFDTQEACHYFGADHVLPLIGTEKATHLLFDKLEETYGSRVVLDAPATCSKAVPKART